MNFKNRYIIIRRGLCFLNSLLIVILTMFLISNLNNLIYYFYLTVSHIKNISKIIPKLKYIKFGKNLSVVSEFKNVIVKFFQVDSLNKVLFIILLLLILS